MYDYKMLLKMSMDLRVWKELFYIYSIMKKDKNYTLLLALRASLYILKGEKIVKHENEYIISTFMPPFLSNAFRSYLFSTNTSDHLTDQLSSNRSAPLSMYLCLTEQCNYQCLHCSSANREKKNDLNTTSWKQVIHDLQSMNTGIIGFTGGEPLLRKDIVELIQEVNSNTKSILFTNGTYLSLDQANELKNSGLYGIGISLDSIHEEVHNHIRNHQTAFQFALQAIKNAKEANLYTMVQTVILKNHLNEYELFELFKLVESLGAHEIKILEPLKSGKLIQSSELEMFYTEEDRNYLNQIQHKANKKFKNLKISTFVYTESKEKFGCGAGIQHSYIAANGDVYPCDFVPIRYGNIQNESIRNIWKKMNSSIQKPGCNCLANQLNDEIYERSNGILPIDSMHIQQQINDCRKDCLPDFHSMIKE